MTGWKSLIVVLTAVIAIVCSAGEGLADTVIKQRKKVDAYEIMGQSVPAQESVSTTWLSGDKVRTEDEGGKGILIRLDEEKIYYLDGTTKTYLEMPLAPGGGMGMPPMQMEAEVVDSGEEKKIGEWKSHLYRFTFKLPMGTTVSEIWTTEDVKVDVESYRRVENLAVSRQPGSEQVLEELEKIKGFPVLRIDESEMMGAKMKSTLELLEIGEGGPPAGGYDVPDGYTRQEMGPMGFPKAKEE